MKRIAGIIILSLITQFIYAQAWQLNREQSHINFNIKNAGFNVDGEFGEFDAKVNFNKEDPEKSSFYGNIKVASINTDNSMRDRDLKKEKYFDVAKYPSITFQSTRISRKKNNLITVTGPLTIKGTKKEVSFDVQYTEGSNGTVFVFSLPLNRRDFGVGSSSWILSDDLSANLRITMTER